MAVQASSVFSEEASSFDAGVAIGEEIREELGGVPRVVFAYLTVNHDQPALLRGLQKALGARTLLVGCSGQGVIGRGKVREEGYAACVLGLGGPGVEASTAKVDAIAEATEEKGRALGRALKAGLREPPKAVVLHYDPLTGADMSLFLKGLHAEIDCPVVGGASAHFYGPAMTTTYQYHGDDVASGAAVAAAIGGDIAVEHAISTGCSPVGVEMTITRAEGNHLLELDGRPAIDVWRELASSQAKPGANEFLLEVENTSALAIGVHADGADGDVLVRAAFLLDTERRGVVLQAAIPEGTRVMLHHRTQSDVLDGTRRLAAELTRRLGPNALRAVLGFECGARTKPFLGSKAAQDENVELQRSFGPDVAWAGATFWGEIFPVGGVPTFHNYTYPVLAIAEKVEAAR